MPCLRQCGAYAHAAQESSALVAAEYQLEPRLLELQQLVEEADERLQNGVVPSAEEAKDVWR